MVITVNICKISVHSHKSYIVYIKLCNVCLITFAYREYAHMSHLFIMFFSGQRKCLCISIFIPACGRYIWEISQSALISVKILVTHWQFVGYNPNFDFHPICQSNLFLVTQFVLAIWEILPLALFYAAIYGQLCC